MEIVERRCRCRLAPVDEVQKVGRTVRSGTTGVWGWGGHFAVGIIEKVVRGLPATSDGSASAALYRHRHCMLCVAPF